MSNIDPEKTICLCLDIDATLINNETRQFNGTTLLWKNRLAAIERYCNQHGFSLIVQIITKKTRPDRCVDMVARELTEYLPMISCHGKIIPSHADTYHVSFHYVNEVLTAQRKKSGVGPMHVDGLLLPAIHLCLNHSKAKVMHYISHFFEKPIPPKQLFLLDNSLGVAADIQSGASGQTPVYTFVSAHALELFKNRTLEFRAQQCRLILDELEKSIKSRVDSLCPPPSLPVPTESDAELTTLTHGDAVYLNVLEHMKIEQPMSDFLNSIHFNEYLLFFQTKAQHKRERARLYPNDLNANATFEQAQHLSERLLRAKNELFISIKPFDEAKATFIQACYEAILESDISRLNTTSSLSCYRLFANKKSYLANRNALIEQLEQSLPGP